MDFIYLSRTIDIFKTLSSAMSKALISKKRVFAKEINCRGQREFLVADVETFWKFYIEQDIKNFYEVIMPNAKLRVYVDIDITNLVFADCEKIFSAFENDFKIFLEKKFCCSVNFLILTSHSKEKYSSHVIANVQCKNVTEIKDCITLFLTQHPTYKFVDTNVYHKNQQFRLYMSSKFNESRDFISSSNLRTIEFFEASLITSRNYLESCSKEISSKNSSTNNSIRQMLSIETSDPLDRYVENFLKLYETYPTRKWKHYSKGKLYVNYALPKNYKYCFKTKRPHQQNNSFFSVDMQRRVSRFLCFDKVCYSTLCSYFPLPNTLT